MIDDGGEIAVRLGDRAYGLKPSWHGLGEMERRLGTNLVDLARRFQTGAIDSRALATVLWAGLLRRLESGDWRAPLSLDEVGELTVAGGVANYYPTAAALIAAYLDPRGN